VILLPILSPFVILDYLLSSYFLLVRFVQLLVYPHIFTLPIKCIGDLPFLKSAMGIKGTVSPHKLMRLLKIHRNCLEWLGKLYNEAHGNLTSASAT